MKRAGTYHDSEPFYRKKNETEQERLARLHALWKTLQERQSKRGRRLQFKPTLLCDLDLFAHTVQLLYGVPFADAINMSDAELSKAHDEQKRLRHQKWRYVRPSRPSSESPCPQSNEIRWDI